MFSCKAAVVCGGGGVFSSQLTIMVFFFLLNTQIDGVIDDIISLESSLNDEFMTMIDTGLQLPSTVCPGVPKTRRLKSFSFQSPLVVDSLNRASRSYGGLFLKVW